MIRNPEIQFASADAIAAFQEERLREEVAYLYENSPYYRRMFDGCGMQPGDIRTADDLRHLPVTTKTDLQLHPGEFVCVPRNRIIDYVTTSGTLGDPVTFALTEEDLGRLAYNEAVSFTTAGCTGEDILQLMTTIDRRFMAGLAYFMGARELGCGVIRVGNGIPELQWDTIRRIGPTGCIVVPSFLIKLVGYAQEHGIDYRRSSLRRAICIGEALRDKGLRVIVHAGNPGFKNQFKRADQSMAQWCLIAGESEVAEGKLTVKHLRDAAGNQVFEDQLTLPEGEALARVTL